MAAPPTGRLQGLDFARFVALFGMVIVNFKVVTGAVASGGWSTFFTHVLEGRAAATFVVLAGIGLGLGAARTPMFVTLKRAAFLLVIGLVNMMIFDADIIHYYAFYFLIGSLLMRLSTPALWGSILVIIALTMALHLVLDYENGWNWAALSYADFWTPAGFIRNLFFNGWHPVLPWLSFLVLGLILARLPLAARATQRRLVLAGIAALVAAEALSAGLSRVMVGAPELQVWVQTSIIPPMPLYLLAGSGAAMLVIGLSLMAGEVIAKSRVLGAMALTGRQTLTLYFAHIVLGMGTLEAMGLLFAGTLSQAMIASVIFCALAVVYAVIWRQFFKRGPIEALMRRLAG